MSFISIVTLILHVSENLNNFESSQVNSELLISYEVVGLFILAFTLLLGFTLKLIKSKWSH